ncbi:DUF473 domain-containing protein [Methanoregula sp.]|uniref:DUF473 domain-containing protein n=1 Tax=Methanoregula sp. TaxID=2052170 RepID=UPI00356697C9
MRCAALTSISPEVIKDLKTGRPRTIEIQSTHNVVTIAEVVPGPENHIFLTSVDTEDLAPGDPGICVYVLATTISMKRIMEFSHGLYYEERERMSARVQVKFCATSVVKEVYRDGLCKPTAVDVLKNACYHAG